MAKKDEKNIPRLVGTLDNSGVGVLCCTRKSLASQKGLSVMRILSYHNETR